MAANRRSFVSGHYGFELQGVMAGGARYVEGGDATADVVTGKAGPDFIERKHIAGVKYEDISVEIGADMASNIYDWIAATLRRTSQRRDGAIVTFDFNFKEKSRLNFSNALISEIGFPACDASSKDPAYITLKIAPEYTRRAKGTSDGSVYLSRPQKNWVSSNFKLKIDGLDCTDVTKIDTLTITQRVTSSVGELRDSQQMPTLDIPNLSLTLRESGSTTFQNWHEEFVIKGNHENINEKNGTLEYFNSDLKTVLFTLTFRGLGIFKLTPERIEPGSEEISLVRAEMYCDDMSLQYGRSAMAAQATTTTTAAATTAAAASVTPVGTPVYVQPVMPTAVYQAQLPVLSPEIAAPVRLTRPLKFRG